VVGHVLRVAPLRRPTPPRRLAAPRPIDIPRRLSQSVSVAAESFTVKRMPEVNKSLTT
jgi:hypothetical protein